MSHLFPVEQERVPEPQEVPLSTAFEMVEQVHFITYYQQILFPVAAQKLILNELHLLLVAHRQDYTCVAQGVTQQGRGYVVLASQQPFPPGVISWLEASSECDGYGYQVCVDLALQR